MSSSMPPNSQQPTTVQKFGNTKSTLSTVGLGSHEGKYTANSSVPDLAQRYYILYMKFCYILITIMLCKLYSR